MTTEIKRLIRVRTEKRAIFKRDGFKKKKQLSDSWRKPRGQHNKQREQKKAKGALPKPGFGSPVAVRGMHPSGFFDELVFSTKDLEGLDPKRQAIRISATVGTRKRATIQKQAIAAGLRVLNARGVKATEKKEELLKAVQEERKEKKGAKPKSKAEVKPEKKVVLRAKETKKAQEKKKAPAKSEKPAKPRKEPAKATEQEKPEKTAKPKAKAPVKTAKKSVKSKEEKTPETADKTPKAEPKSKSKPKAKKKTGSEVKKNE